MNLYQDLCEVCLLNVLRYKSRAKEKGELILCLHLRKTFHLAVFITSLGGIVIRRRSHDQRVVDSKPALATFENSILDPWLLTQIVPLSTQEYKWVPGP